MIAIEQHIQELEKELAIAKGNRRGINTLLATYYAVLSNLSERPVTDPFRCNVAGLIKSLRPISIQWVRISND